MSQSNSILKNNKKYSFIRNAAKKGKKTNAQNKQLISSNTRSKANSWFGGSLHNNINNGLNSSSNINSISSSGSSNINNCISSSSSNNRSNDNNNSNDNNSINNNETFDYDKLNSNSICSNNNINILFLRENYNLFDQ